MNTQTGVSPRSRSEANRFLFPREQHEGRWHPFPALLALLLLFAGSHAQSQDRFNSSPPSQLTLDRLRLLAQTQRAAAETETESDQETTEAEATETPEEEGSETATDETTTPAEETSSETEANPEGEAASATEAAETPAPADETMPAEATEAPAETTEDPANSDALNAIAEMAAEAEEAQGDQTTTPTDGDATAAPAPADAGGQGPGLFGPRGGGGGGARSGFAPGGAVAAQATATGVVPGPGGRVTLQFPLNPVSDLLNIYERLIAKTIIKDTTVFDGPQVSLVTPTDVERDEAIRLIEATLLVNGYVIVAEPDKNSVKVLFGGQRQGGQSASFSEGIVVYTADDTLPSGETLIGYFMELDYISPETAGTLFGNHVVLNEFGRITPVTTPNGLLITESSSIIRQLIQLKQIIDVAAEEAPLLTEFVELQFAEANIVAQIIQAAMDARMEERQRQSDGGRTISGQRAQGQQGGNNQNQGQPQQQQTQRTTFVRTADGRVVAQGNNNSGIGTADMPAAQLIPDDRLNRIMVVAAPTDLAYVIDLIGEFDQPLDQPDPIERPLQYVKANDILPVIVDILQDTGTGQTQLPGGRQIDSRPTPVTSSQLATLTGTTQGNNNQNRVQDGAADTGDFERQDQIAFPIDDVAPISVLVGKTRIIADRQSNAIIVIGTTENQEIVLDIIERLDRRPLQVYLATVIGELSLNEEFEFGVDYLQKFVQFDGSNPADGGVSSSNINQRTELLDAVADLRDNVITDPFGPSTGFNFYGQIGEELDVIVTALQTNDDFKVISRPVVYTQNGKRAEITSGQEVPYESGSTTTDGGNFNTSTEFKDVVLKLEVLPTINDKDEVTLDIVQINDRVLATTIINNSEVPVIGKQELNTTVTVPSRSTIVLGGLIQERDEDLDSGLPWFKNLPVIGPAVKTKRTRTERSELMIFIQPIVVRHDEDTLAASYDEDVRSEVGSDTAEVFPEPGLPTQLYEEAQIEAQREAEEMADKGLLERVGARLFKKKDPSGRRFQSGIQLPTP